MQRVFPKDWKLEKKLVLDCDYKASGVKYFIPSTFFVWTKKAVSNDLRKVKPKETTDFVFLSRGDKAADFTINGNNGKIKSLAEVTNSKAEHYIKVYGKNKHTRNMIIGAQYQYAYDQDYAYKHKKITKEEKQRLDEQEKIYENYVNTIEHLSKQYGTLHQSVDVSGGFQFRTDSVNDSKKMLDEWIKYLQDNKDKLIKSGVMDKDSYEYVLKEVQGELDEIEKKFGTFYKTLDEHNKQLLTAKGYDSFIEDLIVKN